MKYRLEILWVSLFPFLCWGDGLLRMDRAVETHNGIYVFSFVENGSHVHPPGLSALSRRARRDLSAQARAQIQTLGNFRQFETNERLAATQATLLEQVRHEIAPWKINALIQSGLIQPTEDQEILRFLLQTEALENNSSILFVRRYWRDRRTSGEFHPYVANLIERQGVLRSKLVGLLAVSRLEPGQESFPAETNLAETGLRFARPYPSALPAKLKAPRLWIPGWEQTGLRRKYGGTIVLNSNIVDDPGQPSVRPLIYYVAFTHGLFSTAQIVPSGKTGIFDDNESLSGPYGLVPSQIAIEAVGASLKRFYEKEGWVHQVTKESPKGKRYHGHVLTMDYSSFIDTYALQQLSNPGAELLRGAKFGSPQLVFLSEQNSGQVGEMRDPLGNSKYLSRCIGALLGETALNLIGQ
ncbi:MAG: hypothetical protein KDD51_02565 [Bdellovibrionales bacterium]|nr:hypothetical protein [Bdellovibrionales bacterium]